MNQVNNTWLNEYDNLSHWIENGIHIICIDCPCLYDGVIGISRKILYKGFDEDRANAVYAAKVAEWNI